MRCLFQGKRSSTPTASRRFTSDRAPVSSRATSRFGISPKGSPSSKASRKERKSPSSILNRSPASNRSQALPDRRWEQALDERANGPDRPDSPGLSANLPPVRSRPAPRRRKSFQPQAAVAPHDVGNDLWSRRRRFHAFDRRRRTAESDGLHRTAWRAQSHRGGKGGHQ